jgi:hypothetical protein
MRRLSLSVIVILLSNGSHVQQRTALIILLEPPGLMLDYCFGS